VIASTTREGGFEAGSPTIDGKQLLTLVIAQLALSYFHNKLSIYCNLKVESSMTGLLVDKKRHLGIDDNLKL